MLRTFRSSAAVCNAASALGRRWIIGGGGGGFSSALVRTSTPAGGFGGGGVQVLPAMRNLSSMMPILGGGGASTSGHGARNQPVLAWKNDDDDDRQHQQPHQQQQHQQQQRRGVKHWSRRRQILRQRFKEQAQEQNHPTLAKAAALPTSYSEMDNLSLVVLGRLGVHEAHKEILKRHIMAVDQCQYDAAEKTYALISKANKEYMFVLALPFQIGIVSAVTIGCLSLPLVFHYGIAHWFNDHFVTTDVPEPKDLETMWEVGSWTWNWMEPPLGTLSFFLLTFQFARSQLDNLGIKPYTQKVKQWRAERLAEKFPQYDINVVMAYSKTSTIHASSTKNYTY